MARPPLRYRSREEQKAAFAKGFIRRGRRRIKVGEDLTLSEAKRRIYPSVGSVNSMNDIHEFIEAVDKDNIPDKKKLKRLLNMHAIAHSKKFKKQFQGDIGEAQSTLKSAYQKYVKKD